MRKIDKSIDFNFIYDEVEELYSDFGRTSIDPVVLIKIVLIQYIFGILSIRQTVRDIQDLPTFNKNYERRFKNTEIFTNIFVKILETVEKEGFLVPEQVYIDSTHIKASGKQEKIQKS
ncbi:MAG: transposase [Clostridium sp.]|uniref:transposase n=1 Tax=Clostridium sp. TaxID=1506 RepID=UPI0025C5255A|nr:transposase [Clostridium sp.]MCH3963313.1 transposase [Clostridium sp.]MCI1717246.1 transposase [Clostridium sp.]MCI1801586.1 transposase [Clostridium sp.]MCI1815432.1 transposase [Clostridium sp.]MCI1872335.1 transposase [Clostridium sp.]